MNKNTFRLISLTLALAASGTSLAAENGTAHQFPNGTWGCIEGGMDVDDPTCSS